MGRRIAVAGGTGVVGRAVVAQVEAAGHEALVLARATGIDLTDAAGEQVLVDRLGGVDAVVDASNVTTMSARASVAFFETATTRLLAAGARAGVRHHVALSIVGCDVVDLPYYEGKRRQEHLVSAGAVPWTILRATQFHEFADQMALRVGPLSLVPGIRCRPVAADVVARRLVELALGDPLGRAPDLAGPQEERLPGMARRARAARGAGRPVVPLRLPGAAGRQVRAGGLLPGAGATITGPTYDEWLARG